MSENMIPNVSNVSLERPAQVTSFGQASQAEQTAGVVAQRDRQSVSGADSKPEGKNKASAAEFSLKFMVDEKTSDVTILILDRASHKVVRTIPPEEMTKLDPGDLLQLFA